MTTTAPPPNRPLLREEGAPRVDALAIVRRHSGALAWPTLLLCAGLTTGYLLVLAGWATGALPLAAGCAINTVISYAFYTVHHDANHKLVSGRNARLQWLNTLCGSIAAIPLQLSFAGYSMQHLRHHSHTNDPLLDPDAPMAGPMSAVPVKWLVMIVQRMVESLPWGDRLGAHVFASFEPAGAPAPTEKILLEARRMRRYTQACYALMLLSIPLGLFHAAFFLWWLPGHLALLALMLLFQWLPHFPYETTKRFHNTRITTFPGSTWLLLQQDHHLIHHLYPSVPWYRYRAVFRELQPMLVAEGAPLEGRASDPPRPIRLRVARAA